MYEALDAFLAVETWDSLRSEDEERFFRALDRIVRRPEFNAEKMGDYLMRPCSRVAQQIVCLLKIPSHNGKDSAPSHNPSQGYCFLFSETFERFVEIGRKALCDLGCLSPQAGHFGTGSSSRTRTYAPSVNSATQRRRSLMEGGSIHVGCRRE